MCTCNNTIGYVYKNIFISPQWGNPRYATGLLIRIPCLIKKNDINWRIVLRKEANIVCLIFENVEKTVVFQIENMRCFTKNTQYNIVVCIRYCFWFYCNDRSLYSINDPEFSENKKINIEKLSATSLYTIFAFNSLKTF